MAQIIAVFGAFGNQGSSVISSILNDAELAQKYRIRAITRDVNSDKARKLSEKGVEVVRGDTSDPASLKIALAGAGTTFIITNPSFAENGFQIECDSGKAIVDAALEQGVKYIIFTSLPSLAELSGGKYTKASHYEAKAAIAKYIRAQPVKSAFLDQSFFMSNFQTFPLLAPQKAADGTWVIARLNDPRTPLPMLDVAGDTGKFVGAILADPDKYAGQTLCTAAGWWSMEEAVKILSKSSGKKVVYKQISTEEWKASLPYAQDAFVDSFSSIEEFGFYGPDSEALVARAKENARGRLMTLEEYYEAHPLVLE